MVALATLAMFGLTTGQNAASAAARTRPRVALVAQSTWVPAHADFLAGVRVTGAPADGSIRVSVHRPVNTRVCPRGRSQL